MSKLIGGTTRATKSPILKPIPNSVYICGKITGDSGYIEKFFAAECELRRRGFKVMNPARLPEGFEHHQYMRICFPMIDACEAICLLPDYDTSNGGSTEVGYAGAKGKRVYDYETLMAVSPI